MKPVIFITPRHSNLPVARELARRGHVLASFAEFLAQLPAGTETVALEDCLEQTAHDRAVAEEAQRLLPAMLKALDDPALGRDLELRFALGPGFTPALVEQLRQVVAGSVLGQISFSLALRAMARARNLGLLIIHDPATWQWRTLALSAQSLGVPVLMVPHAAGQGLNRLVGVNRLYADIFFDKVVVSGPAERRTLMAQGVPAHKLVSAGFPAFDGYPAFARDYYAQEPGRRAEACRQLGLPPEPSYILYCTEWTNNATSLRCSTADMLGSFGLFLEAWSCLRPAQSRGAVALVKLHPNVTQMPGGAQAVKDAYQAEARRRGVDNLRFFHADYEVGTKELLGLCRAVVSYPSSMVIEALLMRKRSALVGDTSRLAGDWGPHVAVTPDLASLTAFLQAELERPEGPVEINAGFLAAIEDFNHAYDGSAARRVAETAEAMLEQPLAAAGMEAASAHLAMSAAGQALKALGAACA